MSSLLSPVHLLLTQLVDQFNTPYQRDNVQALLAAQLSQGSKALYQNQWKSASALSRFLTQSRWQMGPLILMIQAYLLTQLLKLHGRGRLPDLHVMVDLTSIEKTGKCKAFQHWLHYYHECYGLHLVVLYLCCGQSRIPWSVAIFRGKGTTSPTQLAIRLIRQLPISLRRHYFVYVLADGGFASAAFLRAIREMGLCALVGVGCDRQIRDGRELRHLHGRGQQVYLKNFEAPVWISWCYQQQPNGTYRKRYVLCTRPLSASSMTRLGALRWRIEAYFKTMKQRFAANRFTFRRLRAVLRWFFICWVSFLLSHWVALAQETTIPLDWREAAHTAAETFFCSLLLDWHQRVIIRLKDKQKGGNPFDMGSLALP